MVKKNEFKFQIDEQTSTREFGKFTLEPLERGFGITIGNSIRRVLMTSIPGAAITAIRLDGVLHEFSTIEGVKEDVADMIQNLKQVRFKLNDNNPDKVDLSFTGKGEFKAKDLDVSPQFKVMNPTHHIATLNDNTDFTMEIQIGVGTGYVDANSHSRVDTPIGTIFIDSIFNPVIRVKYDVLPVSSAKDSLEKLILEVTTDGTINPADAVNHAASILINHFSQFVIAGAGPVLEVTEEDDEEIIKVRKLLERSIDEMELSVRSHNCLQAAGIETIGELVAKEESEMLKYKNFGRKSLSELVEKLGEVGLQFGMDVEKYMAETDN
ncbi:MAG: DNA-directed RNA polymerase subunit alpha [Fidelibacterota bacterium]